MGQTAASLWSATGSSYDVHPMFDLKGDCYAKVTGATLMFKYSTTANTMLFYATPF
jgi:hypothetical protein